MERSSTDLTIAGAEAPRASARPAVELRGVTKRFGSVLACDSIDLRVHRGRISGLLGENGAGKSTLMKILVGVVQPDSGDILLDGTPVQIRDPKDAATMGLAMVHQHFSLIDPLTVWENVILGEKGGVDKVAAVHRVRECGDRYGLVVDPFARIHDLSAGQRQRVEIIKCLVRDPRVIVLDEPTSVLTVNESRELFDVLRRVVREEERAVVLISHKLDEILHATDSVTILRHGRVISEHEDSSKTTARQLAREMVGREVSLRSEGASLGVLEAALAVPAVAPVAAVAQSAPPAQPVVLSIRDAVATAKDGRCLLDGLSIEVRAGEIVGLAGVEGNGQVALQDLLSSLLPLNGGHVEVRGREVRAGRPGAMRAAGVGVVPEDRHRCGCVLDMSVAENLILSDVDSFAPHGLLHRHRMHARALELIEQYGIATPSPDTPFRSLSGGNQQRVVLARELSLCPAVLVAAHVTRGLDVGAMEYVNSCVRRVAESGVGVLMISADLEEILSMSHRIAVIHRGRIVGEMRRDGADVERIGMMMGGEAA
jgi:general nucleoside transport system ATP-binding protein